MKYRRTLRSDARRVLAALSSQFEPVLAEPSSHPDQHPPHGRHPHRHTSRRNLLRSVSSCVALLIGLVAVSTSVGGNAFASPAAGSPAKRASGVLSAALRSHDSRLTGLGRNDITPVIGAIPIAPITSRPPGGTAGFLVVAPSSAAPGATLGVAGQCPATPSSGYGYIAVKVEFGRTTAFPVSVTASTTKGGKFGATVFVPQHATPGAVDVDAHCSYGTSGLPEATLQKTFTVLPGGSSSAAPTSATATSTGDVTTVSLGRVTVSASAGSIAAGETLTVAKAPAASDLPVSIIGGPVQVTTSQGQPTGSVSVSAVYDDTGFRAGDEPWIMHKDDAVPAWVPEETTFQSATRTAEAVIDHFSAIDVVNRVSWLSGVVTGDRATSGPTCLTSSPPSWLTGMSFPNGIHDGIRSCLAPETDDHTVFVNIVNNRGYAQLLTITGAPLDVDRTSFVQSMDGLITRGLVNAATTLNSSNFILGPGAGVTLAIPRNTSVGVHHVTIAADTITAAPFHALMWTLLKKMSGVGQIDGVVSCAVVAIRTFTPDSDVAKLLINVKKCVEGAINAAAVSGLVSEATGKAMKGIAAATLVVKSFTLLLDYLSDATYPPRIEFSMRGLLSDINANIRLTNGSLGDIAAGSSTTRMLIASGGTGPYTFKIMRAVDFSPVPAWVVLQPDGQLSVTPPANWTSGGSYHVQIRDTGTGQTSPSNRETLSFAISAPPAGTGTRKAAQVSSSGGGGTTSGGTLMVYASHTCALSIGDEVTCWGGNSAGEVGDGTTTDKAAPVVVSGVSGATQVSSGGFHSCALLGGGSVKCWGGNFTGQLGDGTFTESTSERTPPVYVAGVTDAVQVVTGGLHSCALIAGGTVKCWGGNYHGQLGNGGTTESAVPVFVTGVSGATQITTFGAHSCALVSGGATKCWGENESGQLGDGTTEDSPNAVAVTGVAAATAIVAGGSHTCAVIAGGAKCWGANDDGQLGDGTATTRTTVAAVNGLTNVVQLAAGGRHTCAILGGGDVRCWGRNTSGQLGDGTTTNRSTPTAVSGLSNATQVSAGLSYTCALTTGDSIRCWGRNFNGQLGDGGTTDRPTPVKPVGFVD